jgi:hypothetical protein
MMPLPTSPSSSPRLLRSNSSEWHAVVQRNVRSSLLLLLVLSTIFVFSVLYSSHGFSATTADQALTQRQSTDHGAIDRFVPGQEETDEPTAVVPAQNNEAPEQSLPSDISLPSANASTAPTVPASSRGRAEQTGDQSKCSFTVNCFGISKLYNAALSVTVLLLALGHI